MAVQLSNFFISDADKTFNLINNLFDDVSQYQFILTNALAIDMNWTNCLQSAASGKCNNEWYDIHYEHENYSATIGVISTSPVTGPSSYTTE